MPLTKSAKKKLKQDKEKTRINRQMKDRMKESLKKTKKTPTDESVVMTVRIIDKAVKNHIIHKNKAARIKSSLAKLIVGKQPAAKQTKAVKKATKSRAKSSSSSAQ